MALTSTLRLPTFRSGEWTFLKRFSLIIRNGQIQYVIHPVFPPTADAPVVVALLRPEAL